MKHSFGLTTRQVAKLAGVEIPTIYASLKRQGHWRGVRPSRAKTSHYVWRSDEVHAALGIIPPEVMMTQGEIVARQFLEDEALPVTGETWAVISALLSPCYDSGRDPDLFENEAVLLVWLTLSITDRLDQALPNMNAKARERVLRHLHEISRMASSFGQSEVRYV